MVTDERAEFVNGIKGYGAGSRSTVYCPQCQVTRAGDRANS